MFCLWGAGLDGWGCFIDSRLEVLFRLGYMATLITVCDSYPQKLIPSKIYPTKYCDDKNLYVYGIWERESFWSTHLWTGWSCIMYIMYCIIAEGSDHFLAPVDVCTHRFCHPKHCKASVPFSQALRLRRICSREPMSLNNIFSQGVTTSSIWKCPERCNWQVNLDLKCGQWNAAHNHNS